MKKIILIIVIATFFANYSNAQGHRTDYRDNLQFGLKLGFNNSNVYNTSGDSFDANSKFGFATGVFLAVPITKYIGFQPEILYSQKGFTATGRMLGTDYDLTRTTSYIDVPLLLSIKPTGLLTLLVGPQYSYLVHQKDVFANANMSYQEEQNFKNDNIRKNILCFIGGADFNLEHMVISVRAGWDVQNNHGDGTSTTPSYKNVWYQATLGFRIFND